MVDKKVKKWVKEQQALGYSLKEIHDFLIQQGYPSDVADEATGAVQEPKPEPEPEAEPEAELGLGLALEDTGKGKLKPFGKPRFLGKLKFNPKIIPLILTGIILIVIVGMIISSASKPGPETPDEPPDDVGVSGIQDCGVSTSLASDTSLNEIETEQDTCAVCIGENLLNDCKKAKGIFEVKDKGNIIYELKGMQDSACVIRLENVDGTYLECPFNLNELIAASTEEPSTVPGAFALSVYVYAGLSSMSSNTPCTTGTTSEAAPPDEGTEPLPDEGTEPAPEDLNECDAIGESTDCDDGNSSTYDHCFDDTTSGLRQCAHISDPIEGFDLEKARNLTIDASDLLDFCDKENITNAGAYPDWTPGQVEIINNEPPKACAGSTERWCKGWFVECIVDQTRKIQYVSAQKIPFEDSYVVSEGQIAELPVEEESAG